MVFTNFFSAVNTLLIAGIIAIYIIYRLTARKRQVIVDKRSAELDHIIVSKLRQLRFAVDADRAKIYQFHNGGSFITGQSMLKMSLTYIHTRQGSLPSNIAALQNLRVGLFPELMKEVVTRHGVFIYNTDSAPDAFMRTKQIENNINSVVLTTLRDKRNRVIGILSLNWDDNRPIEVDEAVILEAGCEFSRIFQNY